MSSPATKPLGLCAAAVLIAVAVIAYSCGARAGAAQYRYALSHSPASARLAHRLQAQPTAQPFSRRAAIAVATGAAGLRMNAPEAKAEDLAVVSAPEASSSAPEAAPPAAGTGSGGGSLAQPLAAYAVGLGVFQFQRRQYVASLTSEDFAKYVSVETLVEGNGKDFPEVGKEVTVHYVGTLTDGTQFDSSRDRGQPFTFKIGTQSVIKGWDAAVLRMSVGETARILIQPEWGYGANGSGPIPPNAVLTFEVELLAV